MEEKDYFKDYYKIDLNYGPVLRFRSTCLCCGGKSLNGITSSYMFADKDEKGRFRAVEKYYSFEEVLLDRMQAFVNYHGFDNDCDDYYRSAQKVIILAASSGTLNNSQKENNKTIRKSLEDNGWARLFTTDNSAGGSTSLEVWGTAYKIYDGEFTPIKDLG